MYRLTDAWNLEKKEIVSPFDTFINSKLKEKSLRQVTKMILSPVPSSPKHATTPVKALMPYELPSENVSTASES
jgi:hypothetical protein